MLVYLETTEVNLGIYHQEQKSEMLTPNPALGPEGQLYATST